MEKQSPKVFQLSRRGQETNRFLVSHAQDCISFDAGDAYPPLMPDLTAEAALALDQYRAESLQYGPRLGLPALRECISDFMAADGASISPAEIIVVNGAKQGLDLICKLFLNEGDCVAVTGPTYFTGIPILRSHGVSFLQVPQDAEGMSVAFLRHEIDARRRAGRPIPKLIYDIPDFHNPTGITMSLRRRQQLLNLADDVGILLVEDSPYRHIRFEGDAVPSLKSLDRNGCVAYLGTFAKLLTPGLRIGWIASTAENVARIAQLKADGGTAPLLQRIAVEYYKAGKLLAHVKRVCDEQKIHRDTMFAALRANMPKASINLPEGGYYMWVGLPDGSNADHITAASLEKGVEIISGTRFFADSNTPYPGNRSPGSDFVRLAYSFAAPAEIDEGIRRLASLWH